VTQAFSAGLLATAGNLVFVPAGDGHLVALTADKGEKVWDSGLLVAGLSTPVSYGLDGQQYVSVIAGRGGNTPTRIYTFKIDGKAAMPAAATK
jgi:quinohemoprotein ethanol dehydrogenase